MVSSKIKLPPYPSTGNRIHLTKVILPKLKNFLPVIILVLLGIIFPIIWFGVRYFVTTGDFGFFFYNHSDRIFNSFFSWNDLTSTGIINSTSSLAIPFQFFLFFLEKIGSTTAINQVIVFSLLFIVSSVSFYFWILEIAETGYKYIRAISAVTFFIFNYFSLFVWSRFSTLIFIPSFCSLLLLMLYRGFNTKKYFRYAFLFNLCSLLFSIAYLNIGYVVPVFIIIFILYLYMFLINVRKDNFRGLILYGMQIMMFWIILNLWWILPSFSLYKEAYSLQYSNTVMDSLQWLNYTGSLFSLRGLILLNIVNKQYSLLDIVLFFIVPIIVAIPIFRKFNKSKIYLIFYPILVISLFLMKGAKEPFGNVFLWLFSHVPGFQMFRYASEKFGILALFSLPVLFGFGVERLFELLKGKKIALIMTSLILIMLPINLNPLFSGSFMPHDQKSTIEVPKYYKEVKNILDEDLQKYRIISFPMIQYYYVTYNWPHGYFSIEDSGSLYNKPVISSRLILQHVNSIPYYLYSTLENPRSFSQMCAILNAKYVLINWDRDPYYEEDTAESSYGYMNRNEYFNKVGRFGEIDVFRIKNNYFQDLFYIPKNFYLFSEDPEGMIYLLNNSNFIKSVKDNAFIFSSQNKEASDLYSIANEIFVSKYRNSNDDAKYTFKSPYEVPVSGKYSIYLIGDKDNDQYPDSLIISNLNSGENKKFKIEDVNNNEIFFGSTKLKKGDYQIKIFKDGSEISDVDLMKKVFLVLDKESSVDNTHLEYRKINNTKYLVKLKSPTEKTFLIFSATYDRNWEISSPDIKNNIFKQIKINGGLNSWIIENKNNNDDVNLVISYRPQRYFYIGLLISASSFFMLIGLSIYFYIRKKNKIR